MNDVHFSSKTDQWSTPQWFFDRLNSMFCFDLDVCEDETNHKCETYFTKEQDGLKQQWSGHRVWCNPPYGRGIKDWVRKAAETVELYKDGVVVMLVPARTDTSWYHDYILNNPNASTIFLRGRLYFGAGDGRAPFPSMVVVFMNLSE